MARQSRLWPIVRTFKVATLARAGFDLAGTDPSDSCPTCGCPLGEHEAILPGDAAADMLPLAVGWVECEPHDMTCGDWGIAGSRR